jgi:hypothetical protein
MFSRKRIDIGRSYHYFPVIASKPSRRIDLGLTYIRRNIVLESHTCLCYTTCVSNTTSRGLPQRQRNNDHVNTATSRGPQILLVDLLGLWCPQRASSASSSRLHWRRQISLPLVHASAVEAPPPACALATRTAVASGRGARSTNLPLPPLRPAEEDGSWQDGGGSTIACFRDYHLQVHRFTACYHRIYCEKIYLDSNRKIDFLPGHSAVYQFTSQLQFSGFS